MRASYFSLTVPYKLSVQRFVSYSPSTSPSHAIPDPKRDRHQTTQGDVPSLLSFRYSSPTTQLRIMSVEL
ncbi:hypothetical protein K439DRAFT_1641249, partial [Ramaria rubella]